MEVRLVLADPDGDLLEVVAVGGMGQPMLAVFVTQEDEQSGVNVTLGAARILVRHLQDFIESNQGKEATDADSPAEH